MAGRMEPQRLRSRRLIRRMLEIGILDLDSINEGCADLGLHPIPPAIIPTEPPKPRIQITSRNDGAGYVYLVKCGELHKIGSSRNAIHRLGSLQTGSPEPLELILTIQTKQYF